MKKKMLIFMLVLIMLSGCNSVKTQAIVSKKDMKPRLIQTTSSQVDEITKECIPSVVAISATTQNYQSVGSGVCVAEKGLIVTNYHVVNGANRIYLYLADGTICGAKLLWKDKSLDIALLKSETELPWLSIAKEGSYNIGEEVIAIGTPLDLNFKHSVTKGVISATNRTLQVDGDGGYSSMAHLLQHDASINPGNSGGPLLNKRGEIIGINTVKVEDAEGMGFAIVCDTIEPVIKNYTKGNVQKTGYLGVFGYDASLEDFGSKSYGLKIVSIDENSPLNYFNISKGDIITKINNKKIKNYISLKKELYSHKKGDKVELEILSNGEYETIKVNLIESPN